MPKQVKMKPKKRAFKRRMTAVWILDYVENNDGSITIQEYYRDDGVEIPDDATFCNIQESEKGRTALAVEFGPKGTYSGGIEGETFTKPVKNQRHVFSYSR